MEELVLKAKKRTEKGTGVAKRLRRQGLVPGILYGGSEVVPLTFAFKDLQKILSTKSGENTIFQLNIEGAENRERNVIVRELQSEPVKGGVLHADFYEISMDKEITVSVEIVLEGEPVGVSEEGGMLNHLLREIEIECLPTNIPESIKVDVTELRIGDVLHLKDISIPAGVKVLEEPEEAIVSVTAIVEEVEAPPEEEEAVEGEEAKEEAKEAEGAEKGEKKGKAEEPEKSEKSEKSGKPEKSEKKDK